MYLLSPALTDQTLKYGVLRPIYWHARSLIEDPVKLIFQGTKGHLWFLVSLLLALWSLALMVHLNVKKRNILVLSVALYSLGLLGGAYASTPVGINLHFPSTNFIFFSMLYVTIGWGLAQHNVKISSIFAISLIGFGLAAQLAEAYFIWKYWQVSPTKYSYYIGTIFFGIGVVLFLLRKKEADPNTMFSRIGRYSSSNHWDNICPVHGKLYFHCLSI